MDTELINDFGHDIETLKSLLTELCDLLNANNTSHKIYTQDVGSIVEIEDFSIPYKNFYYGEEDEDGNRVNTYYGYIFANRSKSIIDLVQSINELKDKLSNTIKTLRVLFKKNPPLLNKLLAAIDLLGRINLKELTRHIVLVDPDNGLIKRVSFQTELINKGKGRCLTASEISFVLEHHFDGEAGKYAQDLQILNHIPSNELLSPISSLRVKCRVNVRTEDETIKGKYCAIPIIILGCPTPLFKTNLNTIYERTFKRFRSDQQLEETPLLAFRSFTRKKDGFKQFLTNSELKERHSYLLNSFF